MKNVHNELEGHWGYTFHKICVGLVIIG